MLAKDQVMDAFKQKQSSIVNYILPSVIGSTVVATGLGLFYAGLYRGENIGKTKTRDIYNSFLDTLSDETSNGTAILSVNSWPQYKKEFINKLQKYEKKMVSN